MFGEVLGTCGTRRSETSSKKAAMTASSAECSTHRCLRSDVACGDGLIDGLAGLGSRSAPWHCYEGLLRLPRPREYQLWLPGTGFDGGGAFTEGVNRLPPPGLIDFSVGVTDAEVVGVVVDVSGAFSPPPHAAVKPTMATIAAPPATAARRRAKRLDLMMLMCPYYPRVANA